VGIAEAGEPAQVDEGEVSNDPHRPSLAGPAGRGEPGDPAQ
jgi:hypothetical protein